ncbi:MAG TPA: PAS domain-containing protein [Myxococcota bacterium]|nr:PAS domain-containing protein [Myxococcota bacterium]
MNRAERSLLSFLDAPVVVGDPDGRAVYVNPAFEERFGQAADEVAGLPLAELFQGGGREAVLRAVAEVCERGESVRFPLRERGAGFQAVVSPITADEARVGAVILLKEEVEGVERLLALQREIADPLSELEATLQSLHEQTGGRRSPQHRADLEDALRALARVRKWCDELGDTLAGRATAAAAGRFDPAQLVRLVAQRLESRSGSSGPAIELLAPASLPLARGDAAKLEAILLRAAQDRVEADPAPAALTLGARCVGRDAARAVLVSLSERARPHAVLAPLREAALVAEVLAASGGALHVASDPALGRTTLLRFPLAEG